MYVYSGNVQWTVSSTSYVFSYPPARTCLDYSIALSNNFKYRLYALMFLYRTHPRNLFFCCLRALMMALSGVSDSEAVACLMDSVSAMCRTVLREQHKLDCLTVQAHEYIPFFFVTNCCKTCSNLIVLDYTGESGKGRIVRVDMLAKGQTCGSVFMSIIDDCLIRQSTKVVEGCYHFRSGTLEEATTACDEKGISCKYATGLVLVFRVGDVVADRVLSVARSSKAPGM
jgi:hypothetical protein